MSKKPPASEVFKDYVPEIITYDPAVDYGDEWMQRDEHLKAKERLIEQILKKKKSKNKGAAYRAPIRTENMQGNDE